MLLNLRSRIPVRRFARAFSEVVKTTPEEYTTESTFSIVKPDGMNHLGAIFDILHEEGYYIRNLRMTRFNKALAKVFYEEHLGQTFFEPFREFMVSGPIIGMQLKRLDAIKHFRDLIGPTDSQEAREVAPESIRARFGTDNRVNVIHGADSEATVVREMDYFFGTQSLMRR